MFGDGTPVYLLEVWQPPEEVAAGWLRELPSRMLNARHEVVPFTGRAEDLDELRQWRESRPWLAARWLYGPGGQGKTRLANQFAARSQADGWKVVVATHGPGSVLPQPGTQDLQLDGYAGLLMIVDYADRWSFTHLSWLCSNALLHQPGVRTRILMLARTDDAWPTMRSNLEKAYQASTSRHLLRSLADSSDQRDEMFRAACEGFGIRYMIDPEAIEPPGPLDDSQFGLILALHMAALVAVDAYVTGKRPPADMAGLTVYLLDREHLHWAHMYGDGGHEASSGSGGYTTPPQVMNQAVFTAALAGLMPRPAGLGTLARIDVGAHPERTLADHARCYPATVQGSVLEPLYPDRLAEDFLAVTLPGHLADYPGQRWAATILPVLLSPEPVQQRSTPSLY